MATVFITILNISISAGWMILGVMLLRCLFKKTPRWIVCIMWAFVAVRLLLPFSFESELSLLPSAETIPPEILSQDTPAIDSGLEIIDEAVNPVLEGAAAIDGVSPLETGLFIASIVWMIGMIVFLLLAEVSYLRLRWRISTATPLRDNLRQGETVSSPFLFGLLNPRIYIPLYLEPSALNYVIMHEQTHLKRRDYLSKPFAFVLLAIHWFNPLMWVAYYLFCRDIEVACDERVVRDLTTDQRKEYAAALLECRTNTRLPAICPVSFGEISIKERIKKVVSYKKPVVWASAVSLLLCLFVGGCYLTSPVEKTLVSTDALAVSTTTATTTTSATSALLIVDRTTTTTATKLTTVTTTVKAPAALIICTHPGSVTEVEMGDTVQYTIGVSGGVAPYTYQWQRYENNGWSNIMRNALVHGENTSTLSLTTDAIDGAPTNALAWIRKAQVRCKVTDAVGNSVYSDAAVLKMKFIAYIAPDLYTSNLLYARTVGGEGTKFSYQWEFFDPNGLKEWQSVTSCTGGGVILRPYPSSKLPYSVGNSLFDASVGCRYRCTVTDESGEMIMTEDFEYTGAVS